MTKAQKPAGKAKPQTPPATTKTKAKASTASTTRSKSAPKSQPRVTVSDEGSDNSDHDNDETESADPTATEAEEPASNPVDGDNSAVTATPAKQIKKREGPKSKEPYSAEDALKNNPEGVRVIYNLQNLHGLRSITTYLGFDTIDAFIKFVTDDSIRAYLTAFTNAKNAGFNIPNVTARTAFPVKTIFKALEDTKDPDTFQVLDTFITKQSMDFTDEKYMSFGERKTSFGVMFYIMCMLNIWICFKEDYPDIADKLEGDDEVKYMEIRVEDWNRALMILTFWQRDGAQKVKEGKLKAHGSPVSLQYLTDNQVHTESTPKQIHRTNGIPFGGRWVTEYDGCLAEDVKSYLADLRTYNLDNDNTVKLIKRDMTNPRIPLSDEDRKAFLQTQVEKVKVLHESFSDSQHFNESRISNIQALNACDEDYSEESEDSVHIDEQAAEFYALQRQVNAWTSSYRSYFSAATEVLHQKAREANDRAPQVPSLKNPGETIPNLRLSALQVVALAWMMEQSTSPMHGGILALDCGSGKTLTCLSYLVFRAKQVQEAWDRGDRDVDCRPTLILVPNKTVLEVWLREVETYFKDILKVRIFHGNPSDQKLSIGRRHMTYPIEATYARKRIDHDFPEDDPASARGVIFSTYATFPARTLVSSPRAEGLEELNRVYEENKKELKKAEDEGDDVLIQQLTEKLQVSRKITRCLVDVKAKKAKTGDTDVDDIDISQIQKQAFHLDSAVGDIDDVGYVWFNAFRGAFAKVICDEGQYVKTSKSKAHKSVHTLFASEMWIVSATPADNKVTDLLGALNLFWDPAWFPDGDNVNITSDLYNEDEADIIVDSWPGYRELYHDKRLWTLSPRSFAYLANKDRLTGVTARTVLRSIIGLLVLRLSSATIFQVNGKDVSLASTIPHYRVATVEVEHDAWNQRSYAKMFDDLLPKLSRPDSSKTGGEGKANPRVDRKGLRDTRVHRHLSISNSDLRLAELNARVATKKTSSAEIQRYLNDSDGGVTFYFMNTCTTSGMTPYADSWGMATYICGQSPKFSYICKLLQKHVFGQDEKVVIWFQWPVEGWDVHMLLLLLGIPFYFIGSSSSLELRDDILFNWNNKDDPCRVLLASIPCVGQGVNIQHASWVSVLLSMPNNLNQLIQVIGRQHRVGQRHEQVVYILTLAKSYDMHLQAKACKKMILQLLGQSLIDQTSYKTSVEQQQWVMEALNSNDEATVDAFFASLTDRNLVSDADEIIQSMFGLRCSRLTWAHKNVIRTYKESWFTEDDYEPPSDDPDAQSRSVAGKFVRTFKASAEHTVDVGPQLRTGKAQSHLPAKMITPKRKRPEAEPPVEQSKKKQKIPLRALHDNSDALKNHPNLSKSTVVPTRTLSINITTKAKEDVPIDDEEPDDEDNSSEVDEVSQAEDDSVMQVDDPQDVASSQPQPPKTPSRVRRQTSTPPSAIKPPADAPGSTRVLRTRKRGKSYKV